jgi:hypothetical protein
VLLFAEKHKMIAKHLLHPQSSSAQIHIEQCDFHPLLRRLTEGSPEPPQPGSSQFPLDVRIVLVAEFRKGCRERH